MFISVLRKGHTSYYECKRVHLRSDTDNGDQMVLCMEDGDVNLVIEKATTEIWLMNDAGKTLDHFHW